MPAVNPTLHELKITANKVTFKGTDVPMTAQEVSDLYVMATNAADIYIALEKVARDAENLSEL